MQKEKEAKVHVAAVVPEGLAEQFREQAESHFRTVSAELRLAMREHLNEHPPRRDL